MFYKPDKTIPVSNINPKFSSLPKLNNKDNIIHIHAKHRHIRESLEMGSKVFIEGSVLITKIVYGKIKRGSLSQHILK